MFKDTGPFTALANAWVSAIKASNERKEQRFSPQAMEGLRFLSGPYDFFFRERSHDKYFRANSQNSLHDDIVVCINKAAEFQHIFAPVIYHRNPTRRATVRPIELLENKIDPALFQSDPMLASMAMQAYRQAQMDVKIDRAVASMFEIIQNITPNILNLEAHARRAVDEALITGLSLLWHDYTINPATGTKVCGSFWGSSRYFHMDPDAKSIDDVRWVARENWMPAWQVERIWRLPPGTIQASGYTATELASAPGFGNQHKPDLVCVYEVWSKMGCGGRLPDVRGCSPDYRVAYEALGDYCYLVIVPNHPYPLNLPPWMFRGDPDQAWLEAQRSVQWPTPYWIEGGWPFTPIYFHEVPNDPWPLSHLTPAIGELKMLNWLFAKMVSKIAVTSRDFIVISDSIDEKLEELIKHGPDLTVLKVGGTGTKSIDDLVSFLQHPQWNNDFWLVVQAIANQFDMRVGLTDLMYGMSTRGMRSAEEASQKYNAVNVRPDDMARKMDTAMHIAAQREKLCLRWHMTPDDVMPILGPLGAFAWQTLVYTQPFSRMASIQMRVESDSSRRPNRANLADALQQTAQIFLPIFTQMAGAGNPGPYNAFFQDFAYSIGLPEPERYMIQAPAQQPAAPAPQQQQPNLPSQGQMQQILNQLGVA